MSYPAIAVSAIARRRFFCVIVYSPADRAFWLGLSQFWSRWSDAIVIVKPDTVVRWHRTGFRLFWRWKSRARTPAKDDVAHEVKQLIRRMAEGNVGWGAPRIHGELLAWARTWRRTSDLKEFHNLFTRRAVRRGQKVTDTDRFRPSFVPHEGRSSCPRCVAP